MLCIVPRIAESHIVICPKFWDFKELFCAGEVTCLPPKIIFYADQELVSDLRKQVIVTPFILQSFERSVVPLPATCSLFLVRYNKFHFSEELLEETLRNMFRPEGSCIKVG